MRKSLFLFVLPIILILLAFLALQAGPVVAQSGTKSVQKFEG